MPKTHKVLKSIPLLKKRYDALAVGKRDLLQLIAESEVSEQVYNSNAIENSTLTLDETEKILLQIDVDRFITERELFEAKNLARVISYMGKKAVEQEVTLERICVLHGMLLANIRDDIAGRFRREGEFVRVGSHIAPPPSEVVERVENALTQYRASGGEHIVKRIARFHLAFEYTHPFCDGNGRIGRVLSNYLLIRDGYVPINIAFVNRAQYYDAFKEFDASGQTAIMEEIVGKALANSYHKRLAYLEGARIITLGDYARAHGLAHGNLINKAHRQTIPAFLERGVWKMADHPRTSAFE
jgi:Fic family protein